MSIKVFNKKKVSAADIVVNNLGFQTPELVEYDLQDDVYLVANIHGSPFDKDNNGFISKLSSFRKGEKGTLPF